MALAGWGVGGMLCQPVGVCCYLLYTMQHRVSLGWGVKQLLGSGKLEMPTEEYGRESWEVLQDEMQGVRVSECASPTVQPSPTLQQMV